MADTLWKCPFKAHKDEDVENIPTDYLEWLLDQPWFAEKYSEGFKAVKQEVAYREKFGESKEEDTDKDWNRGKRW